MDIMSIEVVRKQYSSRTQYYSTVNVHKRRDASYCHMVPRAESVPRRGTYYAISLPSVDRRQGANRATSAFRIRDARASEGADGDDGVMVMDPMVSPRCSPHSVRLSGDRRLHCPIAVLVISVKETRK